jgi:TPR repeat protein
MCIKLLQFISNMHPGGNAEAMNGLANLYNNGLGTAVDETEALKWYKKSADAGYVNAWFNIGNSYKMGIGVPIDFKKAYEAFSKGAALNNGLCFYGQGYMLYKGLGITQDYAMAADLFKKGASVHDVGSMFMLGLCYRNGYGTVKNTDSARFYLTRAAARKDIRAVEELQNLNPENNDMAIEAIPQAPKTVSTPIKLQDGFKKIKQNLAKNSSLTGKYEGYLIKFDWSGQHIICTKPTNA